MGLLFAVALRAVDPCTVAAFQSDRDGSEIVIRGFLEMDGHSIYLTALPPNEKRFSCMIFAAIPGLPRQMYPPGDYERPTSVEAEQIHAFLVAYNRRLRLFGEKRSILRIRGTLRIAAEYDAAAQRHKGFGYQGSMRMAIIVREISEER